MLSAMTYSHIMKPLFVILSVLLLCALLPAQTATDIFDSGNTFLNHCAAINNLPNINKTEEVDIVACIGYIRGFGDGVGAQWGIKPDQPMPYCPPQTGTSAQAVRVVLQYIKDHPAEAHLPVGILAYRAMVGAFPCK